MALTPELFVSALATHCRDAAVMDCVSTYMAPPGRSPASRTLQLSSWFKALQPDEREMVIAAMTDAAHATLFGVLAAFDGARTIDSQRHGFVVMSELNGTRENVSSPAVDLHHLLEQPGPLRA